VPCALHEASEGQRIDNTKQVSLPLIFPHSACHSAASFPHLVYLRKSFLSTLSRMVARKPVSRRTVTHELMMENQWICASEWMKQRLNEN
jgi:hypothetical protein